MRASSGKRTSPLKRSVFASSHSLLLVAYLIYFFCIIINFTIIQHFIKFIFPSFWKIFTDNRPVLWTADHSAIHSVNFRFGKCCPNLNTSIKCDKLMDLFPEQSMKKRNREREWRKKPPDEHLQMLNLLSVNECIGYFGSKTW